MPSVCLLGATGLVGRHCLDRLALDRAFERVVVPVRRRFGEAMAPRVEGHVIDFADLEARPDLFQVDKVICALGTTLRTVGGSQTRFREVDFGIPLAAARMAQRQGSRHFLLVSSLGADARSRFFYSRVKGELEDAISGLGFPAVTILRPSVLLGARQEFRAGEALAKRLATLVPGKYRAVHADAVAAVLVAEAKIEDPGVRIIESDAIRARAGILTRESATV